MFTYILIAVIAVILVLVAVIATRPTEMHVERSATIAAAPADVFAQVNDLHQWEAWSPYAKLDPNMKTTYQGPPSGVGASYSWNGNNQVGEGRTTITESRPHELIRIKLEFVRPFAGTNMAQFTFRAVGDQTTVTWSLDGENNFMAKAVGLLMNMDKMVGGQFDKGLAQLKALVEREPAKC